MNDWQPLTAFSKREQNRLKWLLRGAAENGIVDAGVAVKFGREWHINPQLLPAFLRTQTLAALGKQAL